MVPDKTLRVAIGGFGGSAPVPRRLDRGIDGLALAAVASRDTSRAGAAMADFARPVPVVPLARPACQPDPPWRKAEKPSALSYAGNGAFRFFGCRRWSRIDIAC